MYRLEQPSRAHFRAVMDADRDYVHHGEEPYCGATSWAGYVAWLFLIRRQSRPDVIGYGANPNEIWLLLDERGAVCGFGQLRPVDTEDVLTWAGHIGYSVPPSKRGRGCATELLRLLLREAYSRGIEHVLLTCDTDNAASRRVIEKCGGQFDGLYMTPPYHKRLYWFDRPAARPAR